MIWNKTIECASRQELEQIRLEKLKKTIAYVYDRVPFYKEQFDKIGLKPEHIKTLKDIKNIPLTTKEHLRLGYPYKMFAVPQKEIVRVHASSGTTGKPTVVGYTRADLDMWSECVARIATMVGVTDEDICQVAYGYGLFTGGFGMHYGLEKIGASIIPISTGNTEKQLMVMEDFGSTIFMSTPSYALHLTDVLKEKGISRDRIKLKVGIFGAEPHTVEMNREIESRLGILAAEIYGLSEIVGPGVSGDCPHKSGLHINEDYFLPEIINSETGEPKPLGEEGELVITTIDKQGFPLLRYRTKDVTSLNEEPCKCGRTLVRMAKIRGRCDDMLIIKGVNVYPSQVEAVILNIENVSPHYQLVVSKKGFNDSLELHVEFSDESMLDTVGALEALENEIRHKLHSALGLDCKIRLREPNALERSIGKATRVVDNR